MNTLDSNDRQLEMSADDSDPPFVPVTPNTSAASSSFTAYQLQRKRISTKTMMYDAIKTLSSQSRKGFSFAKIRKYISQNYLRSANEAKQRLYFIKKFFKIALEHGDVVGINGFGLAGSFRVPRTSSLHKYYKQYPKKIIKSSKQPVLISPFTSRAYKKGQTI